MTDEATSGVEAVLEAAKAVVASRASTFKARNNRFVTIEDDHGEMMWIVPFDEMHALETALFPSIPHSTLARAALAPPAASPATEHPDDLAVDRFAAAMKAKLAKKRAEGRGGWEDKDDCSNAFLSKLLREHIDKGDPVDVGNLAMMIHQRGERIGS